MILEYVPDLWPYLPLKLPKVGYALSYSARMHVVVVCTCSFELEDIIHRFNKLHNQMNVYTSGNG